MVMTYLPNPSLHPTAYSALHPLSFAAALGVALVSEVCHPQPSGTAPETELREPAKTPAHWPIKPTKVVAWTTGIPTHLRYGTSRVVRPARVEHRTWNTYCAAIAAPSKAP